MVALGCVSNSTNSCTTIPLHTSVFSSSSEISKYFYYSTENCMFTWGQVWVACYFWMAQYFTSLRLVRNGFFECHLNPYHTQMDTLYAYHLMLPSFGTISHQFDSLAAEFPLIPLVVLDEVRLEDVGVRLCPAVTFSGRFLYHLTLLLSLVGKSGNYGVLSHTDTLQTVVV